MYSWTFLTGWIKLYCCRGFSKLGCLIQRLIQQIIYYCLLLFFYSEHNTQCRSLNTKNELTKINICLSNFCLQFTDIKLHLNKNEISLSQTIFFSSSACHSYACLQKRADSKPGKNAGKRKPLQILVRDIFFPIRSFRDISFPPLY